MVTLVLFFTFLFDSNKFSIAMSKQKLTLQQRKFLKKLGKNIKKYRKEKGISQQELGYIIDTDKPHISRAESGLHNFTVLTALRFADGLEINIAQLFQ